MVCPLNLFISGVNDHSSLTFHSLYRLSTYLNTLFLESVQTQ
jgi:hypothetical protein